MIRREAGSLDANWYRPWFFSPSKLRERLLDSLHLMTNIKSSANNADVRETSADKFEFSIVVPTYNREYLVGSAIRSALAWIGGRHDAEIVVVDDKSTDSTVQRLEHEFSEELQSNMLRMVKLQTNGGVIRAKNAGARAALGNWLMFLDSDDLLIKASAGRVREACARHKNFGMMFFRCKSLRDGSLVGAPQDGPVEVDVRDYVNRWSYGECLSMVKRAVFEQQPYDESLVGWEGITYARMLRDGARAMVEPTVAREYRTEGEDRLSSRRGMRRRVSSLARGHLIFLREFGPYLQLLNFVRQIAKVCFYGWFAFWNNYVAERGDPPS
jgi:glycosyltransferase involved in cell wall biosynthesis